MNTEELQVRHDEPNLYEYPSTFSPTYTAIPPTIKYSIAAFSFLLTSIWTYTIRRMIQTIKSAITITQQFHFLWNMWTRTNLWNVLQFFLTFATIGLGSTAILQELYHAPTRIDTPTLLSNKWLPSPLSKFAVISTEVPPPSLSSTTLKHGSTSNTQQQASYSESMKINPMGVHYLQYEYNPKNTKNKTPNPAAFDAIHFHHGFGASSLSWLPAIPSLVQRLNAKVGIAHDMPGFGFTDRPTVEDYCDYGCNSDDEKKTLSLERKKMRKKSALVPYSAAGSAALGTSLLLHLLKNEKNNDSNLSPISSSSKETPASGRNKRVLLFGHSMGCAGALRMAQYLPNDVEKVVVLVAPALLGSLPKQKSTMSSTSNYGNSDDNDAVEKTISITSSSGKTIGRIFKILTTYSCFLRYWISNLVGVAGRLFMDYPFMYILKRAVAIPNFWSALLKKCWGNPKVLSESDAMRFQWPSIGLGWEKGLLAFTRSRLFSICNYPGGELQLLSDVIHGDDSTISVIIAHGTKDSVMPFRTSQKIAEFFGDRISFVPFEGSGHDPFEENADDFVNKMEELLVSN